MTSRSIGWCAGVLMWVAFLLSAEAAGPLLSQPALTINLNTRAHDLVLSDDGTVAYIATDLGLTMVSIEYPAPGAPANAFPILSNVKSLNVGGRSLGIAYKDYGNDSYVFLAAMSADLKVVKVTGPTAPVLVASRSIAGNAWDVAIKDNVAYVSTFTGQVYLFNITNPAAPVQIDVLGLPAWVSASQDAMNLAKLNNYVTTGNAKAAGVAVAGNNLFSLDWNYGRIYHWDLSLVTPINPDPTKVIFKGVHYAPFLLRVEGDPDGSVVYALSAYGGTSGIYSLTLLDLPSFSPQFPLLYSTRYPECAAMGICDYFKSVNTDFGGLTLTSNGKYVVYIAGKGLGEVRILDVSDPTNITSVAVAPIGAHSSRNAESMGVQTRGDFIFTAAGLVGMQVFKYDGLSD